MKLRFSGHRALILGGSCDLAIALAQTMVAAGLFPILTYRSENGHRNISKEMASLAGGYEAFYLSLGERTSLDALFGRLNDDLDFLVDFAQGEVEDLIASANQDDVGRYFAANVSTRAEVLKRTARIMLRKRRGRLVFISSTAAAKPNPGQGFYAASKLASEALYRNLGLELGSRGITTVTLRPGYIDAGRGARYLQRREKAVRQHVPIKRPLTATEIAETILFLLSDSAGGFNATEITLDGGLTAGK